MCGIAGLVDLRATGNINRAALQAMTSGQAHRGPDADGLYVGARMALGHRRLSIIDALKGGQPFSNDASNIFLSYNGEIYNFRELRAQLARKGHSFHTDSDTEVVLHAYEEWGKNCTSRFEGMFAFAVADLVKNELFLARDPFGIKPLVYCLNAGQLAFASEIQALRYAPNWSGEFDMESIDQYLRFQYIPDPRTAFRHTRKLPPGHVMTVRLSDANVKIEQYWDAGSIGIGSVGRSTTDADLDVILKDSVRRHLVADVEFGAFLSGGVDSSLVVGYMAEILGRVKTFSIGFDDPSVSELKYARHVAKHYSTEHHEEVVKVDALSILPEIVQHYGEPFGDQSAIPTWFLARLASKSVPMVLSGDGGDELFAGYPSYGKWIRRVQGLRPASNGKLRAAALAAARKTWPSRYETPAAPEDDASHWISLIGRIPTSLRETLWRPEFRFVTDSSDIAHSNALAHGQGIKAARVQAVDIKTFLPSDILAKVDIASMAFGLEVRPPLLDRRVFDAARGISPKQMYRFNADGTFDGKLPLKRLLAKRLGLEFATRPKQGFAAPLASWLNERVATTQLHDKLTSSDSPLLEWFTKEGVRRTIGQTSPENTWLLLVLDEWMRQQKGLLAIT